MLTHIAYEIEEKVILHPVVVVEDFSAVHGVVEIEETLELLFDAGNVMFDFISGQQFAFGSLEGGVADHACGAAHNSEGFVSCHLQML